MMNKCILYAILAAIFAVIWMPIRGEFLNQHQIDDLSAKAYTRLKEEFRSGDTIAILSKTNSYPNQTENILRNIQLHAVKGKHFKVVDRTSTIQTLVNAEASFQLSGFVADPVSVAHRLGASHIIAVELESHRGNVFLHIYGVDMTTGAVVSQDRIEAKNPTNAYDINGFVGITAPFLHSSKHGTLGSAGSKIGFSAGGSVTFFPEAMGAPRLFFPFDLGVMVTQRGYESSHEAEIVNYTDIFARIFPLNRTLGYISGLNPVLGVSYSMNPSKRFKDDITILPSLSYQTGNHALRFGFTIGIDIGTQEVIKGYKAITPRCAIEMSGL
ncbi:MAG: hypothetical protein FWG20_02200 [Candidatus Cloacimonetes bacterium]|nr:hypothetical protein [Candidatus Cloacimonadota bacterium]